LLDGKAWITEKLGAVLVISWLSPPRESRGVATVSIINLFVLCCKSDKHGGTSPHGSVGKLRESIGGIICSGYALIYIKLTGIAL